MTSTPREECPSLTLAEVVQPRQEELVEHLLGREFDQAELDTIMKTLIVDLCPISYKKAEHRSP